MIPGEIRTGAGVLEINEKLMQLRLGVVNDGDRPIQIGSHFHFSDVNPALSFDRAAAEGFRLDIPSGTSLRFEPGVGAEVTLVELGGRRAVPGLVLPGTRDSTGAGERTSTGTATHMTHTPPTARTEEG